MTKQDLITEISRLEAAERALREIYNAAADTQAWPILCGLTAIGEQISRRREGLHLIEDQEAAQAA